MKTLEVEHQGYKGPSYSSGTTLFLSFFTRKVPTLIFAIMTMILSSFFAMLPAVLVGTALDELLVQREVTSRFMLIIFAIILSGALFYVISFLGLYTYVTLGFSFERDIRQEYFDRIQTHSLTFHDENNSSKLLSMGMTEISQMRQGVMPALRQIMNNIFSVLIITVTIYLTTDIYKAVVAFIGFVLYYILAIFQARRIIPIRTELANTVGVMTEESQEIFKGIEVVRSMRASLREIMRFRNTSEQYSILGKTEGRMAAFYLPNVAILILTSLLFGWTLYDVSNGLLEVSTVIQVLGLLITLQLTSMMMPQMFLLLNAALTNSNRIWEKMNWVDPYPDPVISEIPDIDWEGDLEFRDVWFSYNNGRYALKNLNFTIPSGSKVAVIGGPGSGKSTLLKLLLQLYLPSKGEILISGVPFKNIPPHIVRQHVSRVEQEVFLFSGKIRDNISFAKPSATYEEILQAAEAAQAMEFISDLPEGLDTLIGERGVDLSGGQRQRLAIARAILADPDILLLDDSASALDSKTEELLRKALDNLSKDRMTITVTQRLNTLVKADLIILLKRGEIIAIGTHEKLLETSTEYQKIFELLPESEQLIKGGVS